MTLWKLRNENKEKKENILATLFANSEGCKQMFLTKHFAQLQILGMIVYDDCQEIYDRPAAGSLSKNKIKCLWKSLEMHNDNYCENV